MTDLKTYADAIVKEDHDWGKMHAASHPEHAKFQEIFATPTAEANVGGISIASQYLDSAMQMQHGKNFNNIMDDLNAEARRASQQGAAPLTTGARAALENQARAAHSVLDNSHGVIEGSKASVETFVNAELARIAEAVGDKHLTEDQAQTVRNSLVNYANKTNDAHVQAAETLGKVRADVQKAVPTIEPKTPAYTPNTTAGSVAGSAGEVIGKNGHIGAYKYSQLKGKPVQRFFQNVSSNFQNGWVGKAKTAGGLGAILYFAQDAAKQTMNLLSNDPEKKADASLVNLAIDGAGIAGGGWLMQHGGMKIAAGKNFTLGA